MQQPELISTTSENTYNLIESTAMLDRTNNQLVDKVKISYKKAPASSISNISDYIPESTDGNIEHPSKNFFDGTASPSLKQNIQDILLSFLKSDEYQSIHIRPQDILDAISFLNLLLENYILPAPILADDGEISFNWSKNNFHIDVIFTGNCYYSYFCKDNFDKKYYGDNISIFNALPIELSTLLTDFSAKYDEI